MRTHELKCWPGPFDSIARGDKRCEIRRDDRGYVVGDHLRLRKWDPVSEVYLGPELMVEVTHVIHGPAWDLPVGLVVMSILEVVDEEHRA